MAFDAGTIIARMDLDDAEFDRKLREDEARIRKFEDEHHDLTLTTSIKDADMARARQMFARLDDQLSRDALQRMHGGNGSLLGTLMGLTSGKPLPGMPTGSQTADQSAIGRLLKGLTISSAGGVISAAGGTVSGDVGRSVSDAMDKAAVNINRAGDDVSGSLRGVGDKLDKAGDDAARRFTLSSTRAGESLVKNLSTAGDVNQSAIAKILGAAGPGIGAFGAKGAGILGLGGALLGGLPALLGPLAALGVGAAGAGVVGIGAKELIGTSQSPGALYGPASQLGKTLQGTLQGALSPMIGPLKQAFGEIPGLVRGIMPDLKSLFASAATLIQPLLLGITDLAHDVLPGLSAAFRAVGPDIRPLIDGVGLLVKNLLPGIVAILHAAGPSIKVFSQILGTLGGDLGKVFSAAIPALSASSVVLKTIFDAIGGLLPAIVKLADVFAVALAPVMAAFGQAIKAMEPALVIVGRILAELAGAILNDLAGALIAVAHLIAGLAPTFGVLARVLGQVFNTMESAGVFGALSSALENLATPLAQLINLMVAQLAPILPILVRLFVQIDTIMIQMASAGLGLVVRGFAALLHAVPALVPILGALGAVWLAVNVATTVAGTVQNIYNAAMRIGKLVVAEFTSEGIVAQAMIKAWSAIQAVWGAIMDASLAPVLAITLAIIALGVAAYELYEHWDTVWGFIKRIASDAWTFLTTGWGQWLIPGLTLIRVTVTFLANHWQQMWQDMTNWAVNAWQAIYNEVIAPIDRFFTQLIPGWWDAFLRDTAAMWDAEVNGFTSLWHSIYDVFITPLNDFFTRLIPGWWDEFWSDTSNNLLTPLENGFMVCWHAIYNDFCAPLIRVFTQDLPNAFSASVKAIGHYWDDLEGTVQRPVAFVIDHVLDGLIDAFDWITKHVGLGSPIGQVHPMGLARGGRIPGWGGGDIMPALLEPGEVVVSKESAGYPYMQAAFSAAGVPGFQAGGFAGAAHARKLLGNKGATSSPGIIGDIGHAVHDVISKVFDVGKITAAIFSGNVVALSNAIENMIGYKGTAGAVAELGDILTKMPADLIGDVARYFIHLGYDPSGGAIVKYAESFVGKVPYVWGGTTPSGWDCSGFVEYVYNHFGLHPPRTSESQFGWVRKTPTPVPGGLAFFAGSDGTQADPGHVGIIVNSNRMVDAYATGYGTIFNTIQGSSGAISGYGVAPTGILGGGAGVAGYSGVISNVLNMLNLPQSDFGVVSRQMETESGGNASAVNKWDINWQEGHPSVGLMQVIAPTFDAYAGPMRSVGPFLYGVSIDPTANTYAGVNYAEHAYGPNWVNVLGQGHGYDSGGWLMPGVTVAINNTGMPEAVLDPQQSRSLMGGGGGRLAGVINIMLPEGTTIAQALNELTWMMRVNDQQSLVGAGVRP